MIVSEPALGSLTVSDHKSLFTALKIPVTVSAVAGVLPRLGETSKMGERTLRRLLIIEASTVVRWAHERAPSGSWLERMLTRKPRRSPIRWPELFRHCWLKVGFIEFQS